MMAPLRFVALAGALAIAGCSQPQVAAARPAPNGGGGYAQVLIAQAKDLGPVAPDRRVSLLAALNAPEAQVASWFEARGVRVTQPAGADFVEIAGPASTFDRLFAIDLHNYRTPDGREYYASVADPRVPAGAGGLVGALSRPTSYVSMKPFRAVPKGGLKPADVALAYGTKALRDQGIDGTGETVVIFGTDGHRQSDFDAFSKKYGLPPLNVEQRQGTSKPNAGAEETMDVETVHAIAPGAKIIVYNTAEESLDNFFKTEQAMVQQNPGAIQSHSWGFCDTGWSDFGVTEHQRIYQQAADTGQTVFVASGDRGGFECPPEDWSKAPTQDWVGLGLPDSVPTVTAVGGTRLSVGADGAYLSEVPWEDPVRTEGTTGGVSHKYKAPAWQAAQVARLKAANPGGMRMEPDVAADALAMALVLDGQDLTIGGTSQSAPMWAGFAALMNQYLKKKGLKGAGMINPALYAIKEGKPPYPAFHDVIYGGNFVAPAGPIYNMATGLGSPDVWNLARDLEAYQRNGGRI